MSEKKWPMPKDVKTENWGTTKGPLPQKIDDTRTKIQEDQAYNGKIARKGTIKKWG